MKNQDFIYEKQNDDGAFFAVADGVSACKKSGIGAQIACKISADILLDHIEYYFESSEEKVKSLILMNIRNAIQEQANKDECEAEDYASTLCFVCYDKRCNRVMTFSLGDSRIYQIYNDKMRYINCTVSHSDNAVCSAISYSAEREAVLNRRPIDEDEGFLLCTDGMWKTAERLGLFVNPVCWEDGKTILCFLEQNTPNDDYSFLVAA